MVKAYSAQEYLLYCIQVVYFSIFTMTCSEYSNPSIVLHKGP